MCLENWFFSTLSAQARNRMSLAVIVLHLIIRSAFHQLTSSFVRGAVEVKRCAGIN